MKTRIINILLLSIFAALIITACDKVEDPLVIIDQQVTTNDRLGDVFYIASDSTNEKRVLLEEFTGHLCTNCPEAAIAAHGWVEESNGRLVIYSVHAGNFAAVDPDNGYTSDYTCPTGNTLFADFQVWGYPTAMINRKVINTSQQVFPFAIWEDNVNEELAKANVVNLKIQNIYYPADSNEKIITNTLEINALATFLQPLTSTYKIAVVIVEDHLLSMQKNEDASLGPSPDWPDFDHRNVLRDAVDGTYGVYISADGTVVSGQSYGQKFYYDSFDPEWDIANCNVIAYIYDEATDEVLQVAEVEIKTKEE